MKEYYYSDGKEIYGPVSLRSLKTKDLQSDTLIWHKGLDKWRLAKNIVELEALFKEREIEQKNKTNTNNKDSAKSDGFTFHHQPIEKDYFEKFKYNKGVFKRPFSFYGRISRLEFLVSLIVFILIITLYIKSNLLASREPFFLVLHILFIVFLFWFYFAQAVKRINDLNIQWWWILILPSHIYLVFAKGLQKGNKFGTIPELHIFGNIY